MKGLRMQARKRIVDMTEWQVTPEVRMKVVKAEIVGVGPLIMVRNNPCRRQLWDPDKAWEKKEYFLATTHLKQGLCKYARISRRERAMKKNVFFRESVVVLRDPVGEPLVPAVYTTSQGHLHSMHFFPWEVSVHLEVNTAEWSLKTIEEALRFSGLHGIQGPGLYYEIERFEEAGERVIPAVTRLAPVARSGQLRAGECCTVEKR